MGQQKYELEIQRAIRAAADETWSFVERPLLPLRARGRGQRYSSQLALRGSWRVSRSMGMITYRTRRLVHRFDLRLPSAGREVITIHDLPPARFPDEGTVPKSAGETARRARAVVCPSDFAAQELGELLGVEKPTVIPYGVSRAFQNSAPATPAELEGYGIVRPFVLHAAGATARKNLAGLAAAWREIAGLMPDVSLVLCGPPDLRRTEAFTGLTRVRPIGYQPPDAVARLTAASAAVVVPSLYEGFGLPALEGMACGVPVVAARRGALPEVCGDAALLVEPDAAGLAEGLHRVLTDTALATRLGNNGRQRAALFSWERAAHEHLAVYERALRQR
jgi:glycosyltransferase involved in cell wall biosynthesis